MGPAASAYAAPAQRTVPNSSALLAAALAHSLRDVTAAAAASLQIFRFDHHCYWMGTCIGARNMRWFMAFVFTQGLTYVYGVFFMLLGLWSAHSRALAGDDAILRFLEMQDLATAERTHSAVLSALTYRCADVLTLVMIAMAASAWLVDMFRRKVREILDNRSALSLSHPPSIIQYAPIE